MQLSCEARLWWEGDRREAVEGWFDMLRIASAGGPAEDSAPPIRTDIYLHDPSQTECGIKIRAADGDDARVEVKSLIARRGALASLGPVTLWTKLATTSLALETFPTVTVRKQRRLQSFAWTGQSLSPVDPADIGRMLHAGCNIELTHVWREDCTVPWWTIGYEAFGELDAIEMILRHCVSMTTSVERIPGVQDARPASYPEWLAW